MSSNNEPAKPKPVKKLLFIGEESTHLRMILIKYVKDRYTEGYFAQNYFNFKFKGYEIVVEEKDLELNIWELCISEKSAREKSLAYLDVDVIILCFDRYNLESLKKVTKKWHDEGNTGGFWENVTKMGKTN